jgi:hypothetical protein
MLPSEWGQVGQQVLGNILNLAQGGDGAFQIPRVPQDDRGDEKVQAGGSVLLVLVGTIANLSEPVNEDGRGRVFLGLSASNGARLRRAPQWRN